MTTTRPQDQVSADGAFPLVRRGYELELAYDAIRALGREAA